MDLQIRYAHAEDGVKIAYAVVGEGPLLVCCVTQAASLFMATESESWISFYKKLGRGRRLALFDHRGTGHSDRQATDLCHEARLLDLRAVAEAIGEPADIFAAGPAVPIAVAFAARYPARVRRLVLYGTYAPRSLVISRAVVDTIINSTRHNWNGMAQTIVDLSTRASHPEWGIEQAKALYRSASGEAMASLFEDQYSTDPAAEGPGVKCPVLVMHRTSVVEFPLSLGRRVAAAIPGARMALLDGSVHSPVLGDTEQLLEALNVFLEHREDSPTPSGNRATSPLTAREREVLALVAAGRTDAQIAEALTIAPATASRHVHNLRTKLGAANRAEAVALAGRGTAGR